MPRTYTCRKCGVPHPPPTGKHCRNRPDLPQEEPVQTAIQELVPMFLEMRTEIKEMNSRMQQYEQRGHTEQQAVHELHSNTDSSDAELPDNDQDTTTAGAAATPASLRRDRRLIQRAAERLALLSTDDSDEDWDRGGSSRPSKGKKSGSVTTATDSVKKSIDWPHFYVTRVTEGKRRNVHYDELKVEEFVYGFLAMLKNPKCKMNRDTMEDILQNMMQDTVDFSWANARTFYEMVGVDVEKRVTTWQDTERIKDMRQQYARTAHPPRKENRDTNNRPPLVPAPPNMRCCVQFQKRECPQERDHPPFTHACAYCARSKSALCRHPEEECMRKANNTPKDGKAGE